MWIGVKTFELRKKERHFEVGRRVSTNSSRTLATMQRELAKAQASAEKHSKRYEEEHARRVAAERALDEVSRRNDGLSYERERSSEEMLFLRNQLARRAEADAIRERRRPPQERWHDAMALDRDASPRIRPY